MLNRRLLVTAVSALAIGVWLSPDVAAGNSSAGQLSRHKIFETRKAVVVGYLGKRGTSGFRVITAGTIDGRIGKTHIHGALRALHKIVVSSHLEISRGTEFDSGGSRSFVVRNHFTISNGHIVVSGTGKWTGGTGSYRHARGTFTERSGGSVGGVHIVRLEGSITY